MTIIEIALAEIMMDNQIKKIVVPAWAGMRRMIATVARHMVSLSCMAWNTMPRRSILWRTAQLRQELSEHRRAEEVLLRLNRKLQAIGNCNQILMQAANEQTLLAEICRIVCEEAGYHMAWVGYPQDDEAGSVSPVAWAGVEEGFPAGTGPTSNNRLRGQSLFIRAIQEESRVCIQDLAADPQATTWRKIASQHGYRSSIALPLSEEGAAPFGALCIYSAEPNAFIPDEIRLLEELAGNLALGITSLRMRAERHQARHKLLASEQLFRALVENSPDFIARYDRTFRRIYVNPAIRQLFDGQKEEALGRTSADHSPMDAPQVYIDHLRQTIETGIERTSEIPFRTARGEMHWGHMRFVPEFGPDDQVLTVLAIGRDIHEIKENEQRFRRLAENFPDFVVRFDRDGHYTYVNPAVEKAFGLAAETIIGKTLHDLPQRGEPEQIDAHLALIRRAFDEGVANKSEARWETVSGQCIYEIRHVPEKDAAANVVSVLGIARDITERKRNDAVNASRLHLIQFAETHSLNALLEETMNEVEQLTGSLIGFYHLVDDDQQTLLLQNSSTRTKSEYCKTKGKGPHYPVDAAGVWEDCVHQRKPVIHNDYGSLSNRNGMPDGHARVIRQLVVPVLRNEKITAILGVGNKASDYTGEDVEIVSLIADLAWEIAERKRAEEENRRLNQELEQRVLDRTTQLEAANKELEAFAYSVSHDLRAPLRHMEGFLELLRKKAGAALDEQSWHYMDTISDATRNMGVLIDDLLSFSRMGRLTLSHRRVDLGTLVRDIIQELEPDTAGRDIAWRIGELPPVTGDLSMLRMVMVNLIANAVKFTRLREKAHIEVGALPDQGAENVVYVRDNGAGFDMAYGDKLFGVFQRLHRAEEFEGTGIGLATVHRIIARHGGRSWAEGAPGRGATFYFSLPATRQRVGDG